MDNIKSLIHDLPILNVCAAEVIEDSKAYISTAERLAAEKNLETLIEGADLDEDTKASILDTCTFLCSEFQVEGFINGFIAASKLWREVG